MRNVLAGLLAVCVILSTIGCGGSGDKGKTTPAKDKDKAAEKKS